MKQEFTLNSVWEVVKYSTFFTSSKLNNYRLSASAKAIQPMIKWSNASLKHAKDDGTTSNVLASIPIKYLPQNGFARTVS